MSKKSDRAAERQADALAREQEQRMALFAFDQKMERQAELDRQATQEFLLAAKQELARGRLEDEATQLASYRDAAIAAAVSNLNESGPPVSSYVS